jgi:hypothetical protein
MKTSPGIEAGASRWTAALLERRTTILKRAEAGARGAKVFVGETDGAVGAVRSATG